nr:unnamed protein product [Spirometra erinaceieuropaei]
MVNEPLERLGGTTKTERHADELKETEGCGDGGFRDVLRRDRNLMKDTHHVNLRENRFAEKGSSKILKMRYWVLIGNDGVVKDTMVATGSSAVWCRLGQHVQGGRPGALGQPNDPKLQHVFKLRLRGLETLRG